jgi:hypothetical protein
VPLVLLRALRSQEFALALRQPQAQGLVQLALLVQVEEQQPARQPRAEVPPPRVQPVSAQPEPPVLAAERLPALPPASSAQP